MSIPEVPEAATEHVRNASKYSIDLLHPETGEVDAMLRPGETAYCLEGRWFTVENGVVPVTQHASVRVTRRAMEQMIAEGTLDPRWAA